MSSAPNRDIQLATVASVTMRHADNVFSRDISKNSAMPIPARIRARYALEMSLLTYHVTPMLRTLMMCVMCLHNIVYDHFQDYVIYLQDITVLNQNQNQNQNRFIRSYYRPRRPPLRPIWSLSQRPPKIGCLNIRGLLNKIDEMRTIVTECNFDIMGICETFLDDNVADNEICIEGYTTVKKNRNRHGGGVMLYIKEGIQYNEITNLAGSEVESVWANIQCDKQQLALGIMYRPPSSNHAYLKSMLDQIDNVYSYNENVMLMGDLNYDYKLDESLSSNPLHQIEILYGMRQLINSPTRVTLTTSTINVLM